MKKNFFKKLSFVLVLAMVLSVFAPVGSAFAAKAPKLNTSKKYFKLDVEGRSDYNFKVSNVAKGSTVKWITGNKSVATVDKNGVVTAKGPGVTNVAAEVKAKNGKAVRARAKVVVYDNVAEVEITDLPEGNLKVDEAHDFDKSYTTVAGSTTKTSSKFKWTVENKDGEAISADVATIDLKGIFTAKEAGEYTIVVRTFQSNPKYKAWVNNKEANVEFVTAKTTVKVDKTLVDTKQYDLKSVSLQFDSEVEKADLENVKIYRVIGNEVSVTEQKIKNRSVDGTDKKKANVEIYDKFVPEAKYKVVYLGQEFTFEAATTKFEDVKEIEIAIGTATVFKDTKVEVNLYNENGVIITNEVLESRLTFTNSNPLTSLVGNMLYMYNPGDTTEIEATYHTYEYENGVEKVLKNKRQIVCVSEVVNAVENIASWTIVGAGTEPNFKEPKTLIAKNDSSKQLYVQLKMKDGAFVSNYDLDHQNKFKLTSSDSSVLFVDNTGLLVPVKEGTVQIAVEYDGNYVGNFVVTVSPERVAARVEVKADKTVLSNGDHEASNIIDKAEITTKLKDQYGDVINEDAANFRFTPLDNPSDVTVVGSEFNAHLAKEGTYRFSVYHISNNQLKGYLTLTVGKPNSEAKTYKIELSGLDKGQHDIVVNKEDHIGKTVKATLVGYASNGVAVTHEDADNLTMYNAKGEALNITSASGTALVSASGTALVLETTFKDGPDTVSGSARTKIGKVATGNYIVEGKKGTKLVARAQFSIVDTQELPSLEVKTFRSNYATPELAFDDCFTLKLDNREIQATAYGFVKTPKVPDKAFVKEVTVQKYIGDAYVLDINKTIGYYITVPVDFQY